MEATKFDFDWKTARLEAIATLALNGLLVNGSNQDPDILAKRAIEYANALDRQLLLKPTPVEPPAEAEPK